MNEEQKPLSLPINPYSNRQADIQQPLKKPQNKASDVSNISSCPTDPELYKKLLEEESFSISLTDINPGNMSGYQYLYFLITIMILNFSIAIFNYQLSKFFRQNNILDTYQEFKETDLVFIGFTILFLIFIPVIIYKHRLFKIQLVFLFQIPSIICSLLMITYLADVTDCFHSKMGIIISNVYNFSNVIWKIYSLTFIYERIISVNEDQRQSPLVFAIYIIFCSLGMSLGYLFWWITQYYQFMAQADILKIAACFQIIGAFMTLFAKKITYVNTQSFQKIQILDFFRQISQICYRSVIAMLITIEVLQGIAQTLFAQILIKIIKSVQVQEDPFIDDNFLALNYFALYASQIVAALVLGLLLKPTSRFELFFMIVVVLITNVSTMAFINNYELYTKIYLTFVTIFSVLVGALRLLGYYIVMRRCHGKIEIFSIAKISLHLIQIIIQYTNLIGTCIVLMVSINIMLIIFIIFKDEASDDGKYIEYNRLELIEQTINNFLITKKQFNARYVFKSKINSGAQASVFKYYDNHLNLEVAVKILSTTKKENYINQKTELDFLKQLEGYDNIVRMHKYLLEVEDEHTYQIFLIMDLADCTLADMIKERNKTKNYFTNFEIKEQMYCLIKTFAQVRKNKQIQHRDIKPSNILYCQGKWKIADFGVSSLARSAQNNEDQIAVTYNSELEDMTHLTIIGTPQFMSPQLNENYKHMIKKEIDQYIPMSYSYSDVFSLGLTFLNAMSLESIANLNSYKESLNQRIKEVRDLGIYKPEVINCLVSMLIWNEKERPSFDKLLYKIQKWGKDIFSQSHDSNNSFSQISACTDTSISIRSRYLSNNINTNRQAKNVSMEFSKVSEGQLEERKKPLQKIYKNSLSSINSELSGQSGGQSTGDKSFN